MRLLSSYVIFYFTPCSLCSSSAILVLRVRFATSSPFLVDFLVCSASHSVSFYFSTLSPELVLSFRRATWQNNTYYSDFRIHI